MDLVERIIPADETVLYEGRARGYPPLGCFVMGLFFVLAAGACLSMTGAGVTADLGSTRVKIPAVVSLLVALGAVELFRFARWRSMRYVITTRRVLAISGVFWQSVQWSVGRVGAERACPSVYGRVELSRADQLWAPLEGLPFSEIPSINQALATFDATPPAPLPPPFWTSRRKAAAVLLVLLLLAGAAVLRAAPWRVTVLATWGWVGPMVSLEVDSPHSGANAIDDLDLWYAEVDGVIVGRDYESSSMSGGAFRDRRQVVGQAYYAIPTSTTVITVHGAVRRRVDGREVPFAIEVDRLGPVTHELGEVLDAATETGPRQLFGKTLLEWIALLHGPPNEHVRWFLISRVPDVLGPREAPAVPALIETLAHDDQEVRWIACRLLAAMGISAREAESALRELAERDPDGGVRRSAAEALNAITPGRR